MPTEGKKLAKGLIVALAILLFLFIILGYNIYEYNNLKKQQDRIVTEIGENGEYLVKRNIFANDELPGYIERIEWELSDDVEKDFDRLEVLGIRVVSTGKISTVEIKDGLGFGTIAKVTQLEVAVVEDNIPNAEKTTFNIAIQVFPSQSPGEDISPKYLSNIVYIVESERLFEEYRQQSATGQDPVEEVNKRLAEMSLDDLTEEKLTNYFKLGTKLVFVPYNKEMKETLPLEKENPNLKDYYHKLSRYYNLADKYYRYSGSNVIKKAIERDFSDIKEPIIIGDLYLVYGNF